MVKNANAATNPAKTFMFDTQSCSQKEIKNQSNRKSQDFW